MAGQRQPQGLHHWRRVGTAKMLRHVFPGVPIEPPANKYPPAKPGVFHMRAKPYVISPRVPSRKYGLPAAKVLLLATRKRV